MAAPWEKYQQAAPAGPWSKYQAQPPAPPAGPVIAPGAVPAPPLDGVPWWQQTPAAEAVPETSIADIFRDNMLVGGPTKALYDAARNVSGAGADTAKNSFLQGVQATGGGLANLAGLPVDVAAATVNAPIAAYNYIAENDLPLVDKPIGGSQNIREAAGTAAEAVGFPLVDPNALPTNERMMFRANELGAESIGGGALLGRMGAGAVARGAAPAPIAQPYARATTDAANAATPLGEFASGVRPLVTDAMSGIGAGASLGAVEEITDNPIARLLATLVGGVGGATLTSAAQSPVTAAQTAYRAAARDPNVPAATATGARPSMRTADKAKALVQDAAIDPEAAAARVGERATEYRAEGMTPPTAGLMSDDEGLIGLERAMRNENAPPFSQRDRQVGEDAAGKLAENDPRPDLPAGSTEADDFARAATREAERRAAMREASGRAETDLARDRLAETERAAIARQAQAERERVAALRQQDEEIGQTRAGRDAADTDETRLGAETRQQEGTAGGASVDLDKVIVEDTMRPRVAAKNEKFQAVDPGGEVQRDVRPWLNTVREIETEAADLLPSLRKQVLPDDLLADIKALAPEAEGPGTVSFKTLNDMRPLLAERIETARSANQYRLADSLRRLKSEIDAEAKRLIDEGGDAGQRAKDAMDYYRVEFAPYFAQGKGGDLRRAVNADDPARTRTPPSATAQRFIRTGAGSQEAAADLKRIMDIAPDREAGVAAITQYLRDSASRTVGADGKVNIARLRTWIANHDGVMREFPEVRTEFDRLLQDAVNRRNTTSALEADLAARVAQRRSTEADLNRRVKEIEADNALSVKEKAAAVRQAERDAVQANLDMRNSALGLLLDTDPVKAVRKVFSSDDPRTAMREIWGKVRRDKDAAAGWKKAVSDYLTETVTKTNTTATADGARNVSLAEMTNLFTKHEKVLKEMFTGQEMQRLRMAQRAIEDLARKSITASTGSPTAENFGNAMRYIELGLKAPKVGFGALLGGSLFRSFKQIVEKVPGFDSTAQVQELITRAHFDPELYQYLLTSKPRDIGSPQWNARLFTLIGLQQSQTGPSAEGSGAERALGLTPQEKRIVDYHRNSIATGSVGRDEGGRPMTVYSTGIEVPDGPHKGKFVSVPGWVDGRVLSEDEAYRRWKAEIDAGKWPLYDSGEALNKRSREIHRIMDEEGDGRPK